MLMQWTRTILIVICCAALVDSRPPNPENDWEVGQSPTSGPESARIWSSVLPWSSSVERSPLGVSEDLESPASWDDSRIGSHSSRDPGNLHELPADFSHIYHVTAEPPAEPVAVPLLDTSMLQYAVGRSSVRAQPSAQAGWAAAALAYPGHADPTLLAASLSGRPSTFPFQGQLETGLIDSVYRPSKPRRKVRQLASIQEANYLTSSENDVAKRAEWEQRLRTTLQSESLLVAAASKASARPSGHDRVFIAKGGQAARNVLLSDSPFAAPSVRWEHRPKSDGRRGSSTGPSMTRKPYLQEVGEPDRRIFVYLDSSDNMDHLNKNYFDNKLRILTIVPEELKWDKLSKLHLGDRVPYVLPALESNDLPLIADHHVGSRLRPDSFLSKLTDRQGLHHLLSLWSPVLHDGERSTIVLYGVAEIPMRATETLERASGKMQKTYGEGPYPYAFHLAEEIH
ncbi:related to effector family protein Eff1 [Sporisorium reilianum f. sp. reilianum]|uniref:Related to effector family protein Eff1 n=1 Tax=Sporisorium reilianum f. sp. reilianum TaxID=72559 RepID=A0A2N8UBY7_9BASI|nr:related to effector family protein Eff1 [Sporisorium reilianum f. sp. reilianum]